MEVLGTAASVINLAIKIGNGIQQTHSFWKSVQDSSKEVVHIIDELNVFSKWLAVIADNYRRQPFERGSLSEAAAADTLKLCLGTVRKMNDSVRGYPRGRSFWRAGARKDQIATALRQLERMKTLLIVVQNCHHWYLSGSFLFFNVPRIPQRLIFFCQACAGSGLPVPDARRQRLQLHASMSRALDHRLPEQRLHLHLHLLPTIHIRPNRSVDRPFRVGASGHMERLGTEDGDKSCPVGRTRLFLGVVVGGRTVFGGDSWAETVCGNDSGGDTIVVGAMVMALLEYDRGQSVAVRRRRR